MNNPVLKLENIVKDFRQGNSVIEVLKNVNLEVMPREMIAIIGSSGSGKSTLLQIAGLLDKAENGSVAVGDQKINFDNDKGNENLKNYQAECNYLRLKHFGFIYQYHHLLKDFNARENIAMPILIAGGNYNEALLEADYILETLGLDNRKFNMPGELSGGEQQRVAIGRALINKPKVILADEPTGNLDPNCALEIFNLFLEVSKNYNTSILMVTHNHDLAHKMNKIYELKHGILASL